MPVSHSCRLMSAALPSLPTPRVLPLPTLARTARAMRALLCSSAALSAAAAATPRRVTGRVGAATS